MRSVLKQRNTHTRLYVYSIQLIDNCFHPKIGLHKIKFKKMPAFYIALKTSMYKVRLEQLCKNMQKQISHEVALEQ
jgi:hypothetical protein